MTESNNSEIHNDEVREIMQKIPGWVIRWGLSVVFGVFFVIILGSYFFKYPDIIKAPVVITTFNPPAALISKTSGKIEKIFVQDGSLVYEGSNVALIENTVEYNDYILLKEEINRIDQLKSWEEIVLQKENILNLSLGDIQNSYEQFRKNWNSFRNYLNQCYIKKKIEILKKNIQKQEEFHQLLIEQKSILEEDLILDIERLKLDSSIYLKGGYSQKEIQQDNQRLLQKRSALKNAEASIINSESSIISLRENILEHEMQYENEISKYILAMDESFQILENSIRNWEETYLIASSIKGIVSFTQYWSENQFVIIGDRIATVIPKEEFQIIGRAFIPSSGIGKVAIGQKVNIKLTGYPYLTFGMVIGRISKISLVPEEKGYVAEIELPMGMLSSYSEQLQFIQEMDGTAEIIANNARAINRFVNPLKSLVNRNN